MSAQPPVFPDDVDRSVDLRADFGYTGRWLINKSSDGDGWLLHEPIASGSLSAELLPSFKAACDAFAAFSAVGGLPVGEAEKPHVQAGPVSFGDDGFTVTA